MQTNVVVVGQQNLQTAAWLALLKAQPGITAVATAVTLSELQSHQSFSQPTTIFVDVPQADPEFVGQLARVVSDGNLLLLIRQNDIAEMVALLQAGAIGFIDCNATVPDLARAIIAVGRGEIVLPPDKASQVMLALARGGVKEERPLDHLTDREKEVLALLAQGLTNKDIAQTLILSVRTVEAHLRNIYGKLHMASRTEAAVWAVHNGFSPENR